MKVLVVTDSPEVWGAEQSLADIAESGPAEGVEYTVLAPSKSPVHEFLAARGIATIKLDLPAHPALLRGGLQHARLLDVVAEFAATVRSGLTLARAARGFDGILSFSLWRNPDVLLGARLGRVRAWVDLHETFTGRLGRLLNGPLLAAFDAVVAPSQWVLDQTGVKLRKSHVVPRMVEVREDEPSAWDSSGSVCRPYTAGVFGQLQPHKGHALVIDAALQAAKAQTIRVLFVGAGGDPGTRRAVEQAVAEHPDIFELRAVPRSEVNSLMHECKAIINASEHEAFGRTMIEAASSGAEPIAVGQSGPAEVVTALGFGLVIDRSVEALHEALLEVARGADPSVTIAARQVAVREKFGRQSVGRAYAAVFRRRRSG